MTYCSIHGAQPDYCYLCEQDNSNGRKVKIVICSEPGMGWSTSVLDTEDKKIMLTDPALVRAVEADDNQAIAVAKGALASRLTQPSLALCSEYRLSVVEVEGLFVVTHVDGEEYVIQSDGFMHTNDF